MAKIKKVRDRNIDKEKEARNKKIVQMKLDGFSYNRLAEIFNLSPQRIFAIIKKHKSKKI